MGSSTPLQSKLISSKNALASVLDALLLNRSHLPCWLVRFLQILSQFNCDSSQLYYSYIVSCSDCRAAYKDWLCQRKFPQCAPYIAQPMMVC